MMDRIRVLHVVEGMGHGGAESLLIEHVRHASATFDVRVCAIDRGGPSLDAVHALGAQGFVLRRPEDRGLAGRMACILRLARTLREQRIAVVNGHNPTGALYAVLAARLAGVHATIRTEHSLHYPGRHSFFYSSVLEPMLTALTRRVVCVCEAVRSSHVRRLPWAAGRFVTVANGISPAPPPRPREAVRAELGAAHDDEIVIAVGSMTWQKDHAALLEAFAMVARARPRAILWLVGDGPLRAALDQQRAALRLADRVRFFGLRADVPDLLAAADVFAMSSVREGLPVSLLEAMRAGCASVATAIGGCPELIVDGETGRIVPPFDSAALSAAITELLMDPARARAMGAAGRRRWSAGYTAAAMVGGTEEVYREILGVQRGAHPHGAEDADDERHVATY